MNKETVTVKREELIAKLKESREAHRKEYQEALDGYIVETAERVEQTLVALSKLPGGTIAIAAQSIDFPNSTDEADPRKFSASNIWNDLHAPQSHVNEYDTVIEMLEMSVEDKVSISFSQFRKWVKNEWSWRSKFAATTAAYAGKGRLLSE